MLHLWIDTTRSIHVQSFMLHMIRRLIRRRLTINRRLIPSTLAPRNSLTRLVASCVHANAPSKDRWWWDVWRHRLSTTIVGRHCCRLRLAPARCGALRRSCMYRVAVNTKYALLLNLLYCDHLTASQPHKLMFCLLWNLPQHFLVGLSFVECK